MLVFSSDIRWYKACNKRGTALEHAVPSLLAFY